MPVIVGIQSCRKSQYLLVLNHYHHLASGGSLIFIDCSDSPITVHPKGFQRHTIAVDCDRGDISFHAHRLLGCMEFMRSQCNGSFILTEDDTVFLRQPESEPVGFGCFLAGYCPPEWGCGDWPFLHPPFFVTAAVADKWIQQAKVCIMEGQVGNGTPDVFAGMVCRRAGIAIHQLNVYSTNGLDMRAKSKLNQARKSFLDGAWHIHGIKRKDHLDFILGWLNEYPVGSLNQ